MANFYTHASFTVPCTPDEYKTLWAALDEVDDDELEACGVNTGDIEYDDFDTDDPQMRTPGTVFDAITEVTYLLREQELWFSHDETFDMGPATLVLETLIELFPEKAPVSFEYANLCSRPRLNSFAGGVVVVDTQGTGFLNSGDPYAKALALMDSYEGDFGHLGAFFQGMTEFRSEVTTNPGDQYIDSYDMGRALAYRIANPT